MALPPPTSAPGRDFAPPVAIVTGAVAAATFALAAHTQLLAFHTLGALGAWVAWVAIARLLPALPWRLRPALVIAGALAVIAVPVRLHLVRHSLVAGTTDASLQLAAVALAVIAFGLHFLATYLRNIGRAQPDADPATLLPLVRMLALAHTLALGATLARLFLQKNFLTQSEPLFALVTLALGAEALLRAVARFYQPSAHRARLVFGRSVLVATVLGESGPLRLLGENFERAFGVTLARSWLVSFARALVAPLALCAVLGAWLSTAITAVPVDSTGVRIVRGAFQNEPVPPGLHLHAPWPWARIELVPTGRVQEIALGFERDLAGPVLWAEKHFEGEQNLLVGEGEELLTFNVPVLYRVRDAVTWLRNTVDARTALESLGQRELFALARTRTAFGLMTTERDALARELRERLQAACDRHALGLEIVFVGLKDVHPPVPVAPAYQDVVSAEEQGHALVDQARAYAVQTLAAARTGASLARLQADAAARERLTRAHGETARFLAPLPTWTASREVLSTRLRLEALEAALSDVRQLWIVPAGSRRRSGFFIGGDAAPATLPAAVSTPAR